MVIHEPNGPVTCKTRKSKSEIDEGQYPYHLACNGHWSFHQNKRPCKIPFFSLIFPCFGPLLPLSVSFPVHPPLSAKSPLLACNWLVACNIFVAWKAFIAWNNLWRLELFLSLRQCCHLNIHLYAYLKRPQLPLPLLSFFGSSFFLKPSKQGVGPHWGIRGWF
ncbi:hypothetical protein C8R42DRAFT_209219 [Lentinula raphanica]|nr:hypothetical protein C8R42DRAFT_209219 [Lentinula raphanica]